MSKEKVILLFSKVKSVFNVDDKPIYTTDNKTLTVVQARHDRSLNYAFVKGDRSKLETTSRLNRQPFRFEKM